ncbi:hypothetical protein LCGC14_1839960 [marine sediment metagenome]|uniref:Uncharacterized protein n=1 Tax=marine sediment metagenome TaxID=412755 RepID=A0A0F9GDI9_9ZZZZ
MISPIADSIVSGTVLIDMNATDASGISSYAIYIDDIFRSGTKFYSWDTTQEINGVYPILCVVIDHSGNIGSDTISITVNNSEIVDTSSPNVSIITPVANSTVSGIVSIIRTLKSLNPFGFEKLAQRVLRESGFTSVKITKHGHNGGLEGKGIIRIVQVKSLFLQHMIF